MIKKHPYINPIKLGDITFVRLVNRALSQLESDCAPFRVQQMRCDLDWADRQKMRITSNSMTSSWLRGKNEVNDWSRTRVEMKELVITKRKRLINCWWQHFLEPSWFLWRSDGILYNLTIYWGHCLKRKVKFFSFLFIWVEALGPHDD